VRRVERDGSARAAVGGIVVIGAHHRRAGGRRYPRHPTPQSLRIQQVALPAETAVRLRVMDRIMLASENSSVTMQR